MHVESIEIVGFRGLRDFKHTFEQGKALIVYGLNGTGKSSFFQAITFVITGNLPSVSSVDKIPNTVYRHKALETSKPAFVQITFFHNNSSYWIRREINADGKITTSVSDNQAIKICEETKNNFCFLTKNEFVSMVDAVEKDSWRRLSPFLGHEKIAMFREGLRTLNNNLKRDLALSKIQESVTRDMRLVSEYKVNYTKSLQTLGLEEYSLEVIHQELSKLVDIPVLNNFSDIEWDKLEEKLPGGERIKIIVKELQELSQQAAIAKISNVQSKDFSSTIEFLKKLGTSSQLGHDLVHEKFLSLANSTVQSFVDESCPLCGLVPNDWKETRGNLQERIKKLKIIRVDFDKAKKCLESYKVALGVVIEALDNSFLERSTEDKISDYHLKIKAFKDFIDLAINRLEFTPPVGMTSEETEKFNNIKQEAVDSYLAMKSHLESIENKLKLEQDKIIEAPEIQRFYRLKELTNTYIELVKAVKSHRISTRRLTEVNKIIEKLQSFYKSVDEAESNLSAQLISELASEVVRIFGIITDQQQLKPKIIPKTERGIRQAEIVIENFHGLGQVVARDYLSEANRNGLGLAVYFAGLLKRTPVLRTLVLDDITHSSDYIHRRGLSSFVVSELANKFQLIVLTHDQHWHDRLMSTIPSNKSVSITVVEWSPDGLTYKTDRWVSLLDKAKNKIMNLDHSGGNVLRQALEKFVDDICERLDVLFPFRQSTNLISLNDKRQRLEKAIRDAWNSGNGLIDPNIPAVSLLLNSQRITNLSSHYGSYESWDFNDLKDVLMDVQDLLDIFICKNTYQGSICGGVLPSLRKVNGSPPICKRCKNPIQL